MQLYSFKMIDGGYGTVWATNLTDAKLAAAEMLVGLESHIDNKSFKVLKDRKPYTDYFLVEYS